MAKSNNATRAAQDTEFHKMVDTMHRLGDTEGLRFLSDLMVIVASVPVRSRQVFASAILSHTAKHRPYYMRLALNVAEGAVS